ncbi:organelle RRM domain-containing protein 2, mitochondrial-like [Primulina huaijiensis]|uniref:organelle RRM domain-containing protein 2, mitochondrial-like n=1 Tax=Primulina huaijiensis TaxID=1492673 RepID=UPI003CC718E4
MAMRAAATTTAAAAAAATRGRGLRAMFSSLSSFPFNIPQTNVEKPPPAEPSTNLFVSGLSKRTTTEGLRTAFAKFGEVVHAKVVTDRVSGYSKGYGFVNYASFEKLMYQTFLDGWVIFAEYARPRPPIPSLNNGPPQGWQ